MEELKEIAEILRNKKISVVCCKDDTWICEESVEELVGEIQTYLKEHNYVQLDGDQSLPEVDIDIHIWRDYSPDMAYEKAQQDMLKANFKKVK